MGENPRMNLDAPWPLLGGLSPQTFMRRHWQAKPLLVRQAWPGVQPPLSRPQLFALAGHDDVESRLVACRDGEWSLRRGPLPRRALPPVAQAGWSLLVQGLDLHVPAARAMLEPFRFIPDARVDDVMVSWASDGGGVGPHTDAYDVFLIQVQGRRRWRVGRVPQPQWVPDAPLKRLQHFEPQHDWLLEPGDMLYLPPQWGHDGVAVGECMTCSVGFRTPSQGELATELLQRLAEEEFEPGRHYQDRGAAATAEPGRVPPSLLQFSQGALAAALRDPLQLQRVLGESLTEPKPQVWFQAGPTWDGSSGVVLDDRTRMMYDDQHVFINGDAFRAAGRDARLMQQLADQRRLDAAPCRRLSEDAKGLLADWVQAGWLHGGYA